jgi:hypothetical protein
MQAAHMRGNVKQYRTAIAQQEWILETMQIEGYGSKGRQEEDRTQIHISELPFSVPGNSSDHDTTEGIRSE